MTMPAPRRALLLALAVVLAAGALAGCLQGSKPGPAATGSNAKLTLPEKLAVGLPAYSWDAKAGIDWWEHFVTTYTKRDAYLPNNDAAAQFIAASWKADGLDATVLEYPARAPVAGGLPATVGPLKLHVVQVVKKGTTEPDHAIVLGGHYDTQSGTIQGAYDNGAGTAMVYNVCKTLAKVPMNKTLICLIFDGEELGTLGSDAWLASPPAGTPKVDFYLGYDMTGINWPGYPAWKLYNWVQDEFAPDLYPFVNNTLLHVLQWPESGAQVFPFNDRNSDEANFIARHVPSVRFAGGRTAGSYPAYHMPNDTADFVYQFAGGRTNFETGFGAIVQESFTLALLLDRTTLDAMKQDAAPA